jgi:hypothetical protein
MHAPTIGGEELEAMSGGARGTAGKGARPRETRGRRRTWGVEARERVGGLGRRSMRVGGGVATSEC